MGHYDGWWQADLCYYPAVRCVTLLLTLLVGPQSWAQPTIHVRLVSGESGKPLSGARVTITTSRNFEFRQVQAVSAGPDYTVQLEGDSAVGLGNVTKSDTDWNQYLQCASGAKLNPVYSVAMIVASGMVAPNNCNQHIVADPLPGEVVFFVRRLSLWERLTAFVKAIPD